MLVVHRFRYYNNYVLSCTDYETRKFLSKYEKKSIPIKKSETQVTLKILKVSYQTISDIYLSILVR